MQYVESTKSGVTQDAPELAAAPVTQTESQPHGIPNKMSSSLSVLRILKASESWVNTGFIYFII